MFLVALFGLVIASTVFGNSPVAAVQGPPCGVIGIGQNYYIEVVADISTSVAQTAIPKTDPIQITTQTKTPANQCNQSTTTANVTANEQGSPTLIQQGQKGNEQNYWQVTYLAGGPGSPIDQFNTAITPAPTICDTVLSTDATNGCLEPWQPPATSFKPVEALLTGVVSGVGTSISGTKPVTDNSSSPELVCTVSILNPATWFICPLVSAAQGAIEALTNGIDSLLTVSTNTIFSNTSTPRTTGAGFYQAWNTFRLFAIGLIIIAGLIMLIAQAIGSDIISAYTIRRVLPRLLAAIIFISISWWILEFMVQLTNDVGNGVRAIIYTPFNSIGDGGVVHVGGGASTVGALVGGAGLLALGLVGLGTFVLTAFLAVFVGFIILLLRQVIIMMLIIFAPLAIACYILPGTEKAWKFWRDTLVSMLVAFPIISAFIAMGRVFAVVMYNAPIAGVPSVINEIGAFIMYFLPYFMLPLAFRMAGGAIASVAGFVNDRHRGLFDRLKTKRGEIASDRISRAQGQSLYSNDSFMGKFRNKAASWATAPYSNLAYEVASRSDRNIPLLSRTGRKVAASLHQKKLGQTGEELKVANDMFGNNDKAWRAYAGAETWSGFNAGTRQRLIGSGMANFAQNADGSFKLLDAGLGDVADEHGFHYNRAISGNMRGMKDYDAMSRILSQSDSATERLAAGAVQGYAGHAASLYASTDTNKADIQAVGIMGLASHGFATGDDLASVAGAMDQGDKSTHAYAESVIVQAQVMGQRSRPDVKAGYGVVYTKEGKWVSGITKEGGRAIDLLKTLSSHDLASAKGGAIVALRPTIEEVLTDGEMAPQLLAQGQAKLAAATNDRERRAAQSDIAYAQNARKNAQAVKDQVFNWAGPYSQASVDVKAEALDIISKFPLNNSENRRSLKSEFDVYARHERDPEFTGGGGEPGNGGGAPGGGQ